MIVNQNNFYEVKFILEHELEKLKWITNKLQKQSKESIKKELKRINKNFK